MKFLFFHFFISLYKPDESKQGANDTRPTRKVEAARGQPSLTFLLDNIILQKMKSVLALSFAAGAAAFAPSANVARSSTALAGDLSGEIGAQAPLGFWDPLDMTNVSRGEATYSVGIYLTK